MECERALGPSITLDNALRLLRDIGYFVENVGQDVVIDRSNAIVADFAIHGAMATWQAALDLNHAAVALKYKELADKLYKTL